MVSGGPRDREVLGPVSSWYLPPREHLSEGVRFSDDIPTPTRRDESSGYLPPREHLEGVRLSNDDKGSPQGQGAGARGSPQGQGAGASLRHSSGIKETQSLLSRRPKAPPRQSLVVADGPPLAERSCDDGNVGVTPPPWDGAVSVFGVRWESSSRLSEVPVPAGGSPDPGPDPSSLIARGGGGGIEAVDGRPEVPSCSVLPEVRSISIDLDPDLLDPSALSPIRDGDRSHPHPHLLSPVQLLRAALEAADLRRKGRLDAAVVGGALGRGLPPGFLSPCEMWLLARPATRHAVQTGVEGQGVEGSAIR